MDDLFVDIYQGRQIAAASSDAARANDKVANLLDEQKRLTARMDRLSLLNAALWELVRDKLELSDAHLKAMALEIDARDGKIDGRLGAVLRQCKKCGKNLMSKQPKCQYCGSDNTPLDPFSKI